MDMALRDQLSRTLLEIQEYYVNIFSIYTEQVLDTVIDLKKESIRLSEVIQSFKEFHKSLLESDRIDSAGSMLLADITATIQKMKSHSSNFYQAI